MSGSQGSGRAIQILPSIVDNGARRNSAPLARLTGLLCTIQDGPHGSLHGAVHQSQDGSRMLEKPELAYSPYPSTRADMRSPHPAGALALSVEGRHMPPRVRARSPQPLARTWIRGAMIRR